MEFYPREAASYNTSKHIWTFKNGSIIDFGYIDSENDVYQYQSAEYDVIRFDELTHFTEYMYTYMISRCRGANAFPKHIKSSTNPGGVGHSWVKARFIDIGEPNKIHEITLENGKKSTVIFIPSLVQDNMFLLDNDPDYIDRLELLPEKEKQALLEDITEKRPDVVFVAMGSPKQELLMEEMLERHPAIYQGLGGSFDVYTGNVKRAPKWWVDHNLEFAYRLVKQPSRIKRQIHLVRFLLLVKLGKI